MTTLTPKQLRTARKKLQLSVSGFARAVQVSDARTVRRWEAGERDIPGPIAIIVETWLANPALLDTEAMQERINTPTRAETKKRAKRSNGAGNGSARPE